MIFFENIISLNFFREKEHDNYIDSVARRFVLLFEKHDVSRYNIPSFFDYGLTIDDVSSDEKLQAILTVEMIDAAADIFGVNPEWLKCNSDLIYETKFLHFRCVDEPKRFLDTLENNDRHVEVLIITSESRLYRFRDDNTLLVVSKLIDEVGGKYIYRHELYSGIDHRYWLHRPLLAAINAIVLKNRKQLRSWQTRGDLDSFCRGERFISDIYSLSSRLSFLRLLFNPIHWKVPPITMVYGNEWAMRGIGEWLLFPVNYWRSEFWISSLEWFWHGLYSDGIGEKEASLREWMIFYNSGYMKTGIQNIDACQKDFIRMWGKVTDGN